MDCNIPWILYMTMEVSMLGMGHGPDDVISSMQKTEWQMGDLLSAKKAMDRLKMGHTRGCPFDRFICMNSGSESVTVGMRISDVNALRMTVWWEA